VWSCIAHSTLARTHRIVTPGYKGGRGTEKRLATILQNQNSSFMRMNEYTGAYTGWFENKGLVTRIMHMCIVGVYTLPLFGGFSRILYDYTNQIQTECVAHRNACQTSAHDTKSNYFLKESFPKQMCWNTGTRRGGVIVCIYKIRVCVCSIYTFKWITM
jgi:hypothetical protein